MNDLAQKLSDAAKEIDRLRNIEAAALNLIAVKGRHHAELAMQALIEACKKEQ
jgi:hypothetical protein